MRDFGNGAIVLGNAINRDHPLNRGLVSHWLALPGLVGGNSLRNIAAKNNDATRTTGTVWASSRRPWFSSLYFDGTDDIATAQNSSAMNYSSNLTVMHWVNAPASGSSPSDYRTTFSKYKTTGNQRSWLIQKGSATVNKLRVIVSTDGTSSNIKLYESSVTAYDNTWHQVCFTFSTNTLKLYIDGIEDTAVSKGTDATVNTIFASSADICMGALANPTAWGSGYFNDFRIYQRTLSGGEVWSVYNESRRGYPTMLNRLSPLRTFYFGTAAGAPPSSTFDVIGGGCGQFMIGAD